MYDKNFPYNSLPFLPGNFDFEQKKFLKLTIKATEEIAKLNWLLHLIPNAEILISPLLTKESVESSAIENINTTTLKVLQSQALPLQKIQWAEKEVLHYHNAILQGFENIKKYSGIWYNFLLDLQKIIEPNKTGVRKIPWTVIANSLWEVLYTPPEWEENITKLLTNLEIFINDFDDDIEALIKMPVIHYQFESIHPFYDGNGRTGRVLMDLYLDMLGILPLPVLRLSQYIYTHQLKYYKLLLHTTKSSKYESFIKFILSGVISQCKANILYVQKIRTYKNKLTKPYEKGSIEVVILQILFQKIFILEKNLIQTILKMWEDESEIISKIESFQDLWVLSQKIQWNEKYLYIPGFLELISRAE